MNELIKKVMKKREFSRLPERDVMLAFGKFDNGKYGDEEKVKLTRELLHKVFGAFASQKLLSPKSKDVEWILRKHLSTRERLPYYEKVYDRLLKGFEKVSIIDLGAGINGFSYNYFEKDVNYIGVEAIGQLVDLMNDYFVKEKIEGKAVHLSLFELEKIKKLIKEVKGNKIVFLFKTVDCLEMLKKDYSKKLVSGIVDLVNTQGGHENLSRGRVVVSFATKSMGKGTRFRANRNWFFDFVKKDFKVLDDFEIGGERYLVFSKK